MCVLGDCDVEFQTLRQSLQLTLLSSHSSIALGLRTTKRQKLASGDESITDVDPDEAQSPKRKMAYSESPPTAPSQQPTDIPDQSYLRIVEAVVRVGQHVVDAFDRGWRLGRRPSTSRPSVFGMRSRQGSLQLTDSPPTPIRPRLRPIPLNFSSSESSGSNSPEPSGKP